MQSQIINPQTLVPQQNEYFNQYQMNYLNESTASLQDQMFVGMNIKNAAREAAIDDGVMPVLKQEGMGGADDSSSTFAAASKRKQNGLRRGKWTTEEELYAARLIQEFKSGLLPLTDGTTLRTFLSKLLNCDPMRISKKFVGGNCIGKQVFRRRQADMERLSPEEIEKSRQELAELETKFLERVAQSNRKPSPRPVPDPFNLQRHIASSYSHLLATPPWVITQPTGALQQPLGSYHGQLLTPAPAPAPPPALSSSGLLNMKLESPYLRNFVGQGMPHLMSQGYVSGMLNGHNTTPSHSHAQGSFPAYQPNTHRGTAEASAQAAGASSAFYQSVVGEQGGAPYHGPGPGNSPRSQNQLPEHNLPRTPSMDALCSLHLVDSNSISNNQMHLGGLLSFPSASDFIQNSRDTKTLSNVSSWMRISSFDNLSSFNSPHITETDYSNSLKMVSSNSAQELSDILRTVPSLNNFKDFSSLKRIESIGAFSYKQNGMGERNTSVDDFFALVAGGDIPAPTSEVLGMPLIDQVTGENRQLPSSGGLTIICRD